MEGNLKILSIAVYAEKNTYKIAWMVKDCMRRLTLITNDKLQSKVLKYPAF